MEPLQATLEDLRSAADRLPDGIAPALILAVTFALALFLHGLLWRVLGRLVGDPRGMWGSLLRRARRPARLGFVLASFSLVVPRLDLPFGWEDGLGHLFGILLITLIGWTLIVLITHFTERSIQGRQLDAEDNLAARKHVTQVRLLRRSANILIGIFTVGAVLLTFESVRDYGISLFASAGAAGLVLGFAARPVLANLIAGIQIALTQPIRIEDVVIVEGEWGWIEEILATYVVVRLWDWRRLVVPLSYFIETPFQNWTRENASIIGAVSWHVDYTVPVAEVRAKLEEVVRASAFWDGRIVNLQVTDADRDTVTLRGLMSARTSPQAWDLRCEVREKIIGWLQSAHPQALPRLRGELDLKACDDTAPETAPDTAPGAAM